MDKKIQIMIDVIEGLKGEEVLVLDFEKKSSLCDKVVICTARSDRNAQAIADELENKLKEIGEEKIGIEGYNEGQWILMDFNDVLVHVFLRDSREHFKLEQLWSQAKEIYKN